MRIIPKFLWKPLILPFCGLAFVSLIIAYCVPTLSGIFTNLAVTFIGILVMVCYVEYILRKHEEQRWAPALSVVHRKVGSFVIASLTTIRIILDNASDTLDYAGLNVNDPQAMGKEMIRALEEKVLPAIDGNVRRLNKEKWKLLVCHLQQTQERADRLYQHYGARLTPELLGFFLNLQEGIDTLLATDAIFPDAIGTPWNRPYGMDEGLLERTVVSGIRSICQAAVTLMRGLGA